MSRSEFKQRIYALVRECHGVGFRALLLRWEFTRRPFFKNETKFSPAALYSNTLWLKPDGQSDFDFLVAILRHMGEGAETLGHLADLHHIEQKRHAEMQLKLMGVFQSVRLTKPAEAVVASISKQRSFLVTS
jgi:hypothetical protein